jgi:hypothetical protein
MDILNARLPRPEHHTPPEPGAIRSILAPHMGVCGTYRDMLAADLGFATRQLREAEADLSDALLTWQHASDPNRATWRRVSRTCIARVRRWREDSHNALLRLAALGHRKEAA